MNIFQTVWHQFHSKALQKQAILPAHKIECPDCTQTIHIPELYPGQNAYCPQCHHQVVSIPFHPFSAPIAYAIATLLLAIYSICFYFIGVDLSGLTKSITLSETLSILLKQNFGILADIMSIILFITPLIFLFLCIYVHYALARQKVLPYLTQSLKTMIHLKPWMMVDVFLISILVACVKIQSMAIISFGLSFWMLGIFAILLTRTSIFIHPHWLYYQIKKLLTQNSQIPEQISNQITCPHCLFYNPNNQKYCSVCQTPIQNRKNYSLQITFAFLLMAIIFYLPANLYPMMITESLFKKLASTILQGVIILWNEGSEPIAIIILVASIIIPITKILSLLFLIYSAKFKLLATPILLTKLYRIVEFIGRWSMIDVFVVILMMSLFQFPTAKVFPGLAVVYFCLVVILSMISAYAFDIRLIWDKNKLVEKNE